MMMKMMKISIKIKEIIMKIELFMSFWVFLSFLCFFLDFDGFVEFYLDFSDFYSFFTLFEVPLYKDVRGGGWTVSRSSVKNSKNHIKI